ncbi:protein INCREASED PETAL GROWTH ANISOTROPY 1-like isoform X1 [Primulina tabacum]|uniref:protein INCREASED PETAL GROWTH ANISOTROPY 1-like isoform X1 n=1 Tax=Primulina tabacum TaxID=48773 RepID=UPI003F590650
MVAGKVKAAMGLPPNSKPKPDLSQKPPLLSPPSSANKQKLQKGSVPAGARSFGVYFPRASAQVQPRLHDEDELLRAIEELREKESRLRTEILEQKLLKESIAIVPVLENEISSKDLEIRRSKAMIECLESENERLRAENEFLHMELAKHNHKYTEKIKCMQAELADIKIAVAESQREREEASSSLTTTKLIDVTNNYKSCVALKSLRKCKTQNHVLGNFFEGGMSVHANIETEIVMKDEFVCVGEESTERPRHSWCNSEEILETSDGLIGSRSRAPRVPKPPPRPSAALLSSLSSTSTSAISLSVSSPSCGSLSDSSDRALLEISCIPPPPPPPPPSLRQKTVPPPPPPPPARGLKKAPEKVRRIPEVVEFYHSLMRRESNTRRDAGGGPADGLAAGATTKDMIGEIENRSAHLLAIKTDVETQGDFIRFLIKEVECAAFADIEDVVPFVKWLDDELSYLVDERAVLKHFGWPEQKADALREAAFGYCDLKKMESEASAFHAAPGQPCFHALKKIQSLFDKLEHGVYNLSRVRESATKRYKVFQIPVNWMLDTGFVVQIKLASVKLAIKYMKRVLAELELIGGGGSPEEEELIVQGVKFAFRVHQFAGGFDVETMKTFQELRDKARWCNIQCHNQQQPKLVCRSSSAAL